MSWDGPDWDTFARLAAGDTRVLHMWLWAVCARGLDAVLDAERVTHGEMRVRLEQDTRDAVGHGELPAFVLRWRDTGTTGRWLALAETLRAMDARHARRPRELSYSAWSPPPALLPDMPAGDWWLLPPERRQRSELARANAGDYRPALAARLDLRCRVVAPSLDCPVGVAWRRAPAELDASIRAARGPLVVAIASPLAGLRMGAEGRPERRSPDGRVPFRFTGLHRDDLAEACDRVDRIVARASGVGAHVLLLPELEVPPPLLAHLASALEANQGSLALCVAGSYHVAADHLFRNRATVLSGRGEVLWTHDKLVEFGIPPADAAAMHPVARGALGIDEGGGREDIRLGRTLTVCDLAVGRLAVLICLDYCGGHADRLLEAAGVNLVFVPAMTSSVRDFETKAMELGSRAGACAFIANSAWLAGQLGDPELPLAMTYRPAVGGWVASRAVPEPVYVCSLRVPSHEGG